MVKKLYKHEFLAWLRVLPFFFGAPLVTALFHRILQFFETDSVYYGIVFLCTTVLFVVACAVCLAAPIVFSVIRFYKNLFTGEGYLTFTLPVKTSHHLLVKSTTALVCSVASFLAIFLACCLITAGDVFAEVWKAAAYLWDQIPSRYTEHLTGYVIEYCILLLVAIFSSIMLYNFCLCVGQLSKKNRVVRAIVVYFLVYLCGQILSTVFMVIFTGLGMGGLLDPIGEFIEKNPLTSVHLGLWIGIVWTGLLALAFWLVCRHILKKRLNLE